MEVGGQRHAPAALPPGKRPGTHCIGGWVGPRVGLYGCGKSRPPSGVRSPDRPARIESLYRLSYPGPPHNNVNGCECENSSSSTAKEFLNTCHDGDLKLFCETAQVVHLMKLYHADVLLHLILSLWRQQDVCHIKQRHTIWTSLFHRMQWGRGGYQRTCL